MEEGEKEKKKSKKSLKNLFSSDKSDKMFAAIIIAIVAVAIFFIIITVSKVKDSKKNDEGFIKKMDTSYIVTMLTDYQSALQDADITRIRTFIYNQKNVADEEINKNVYAAEGYKIGTLSITDCYAQYGVKDNEYIIYAKYKLSIPEIETPAVGLFTYYIVKESDSGYKVSYDLYDVNSNVYSYVSEMSSKQYVQDLIQEVNDEFNRARSKDSALNKVINDIANSSVQETTSGNDSTTAESGGETTAEETTTEKETTTSSEDDE